MFNSPIIDVIFNRYVLAESFCPVKHGFVTFLLGQLLLIYFVVNSPLYSYNYYAQCLYLPS